MTDLALFIVWLCEPRIGTGEAVGKSSMWVRGKWHHPLSAPYSIGRPVHISAC